MQTKIGAIKKKIIEGKYHEALNECDKLLVENNIDALIAKADILSIPDPSVSNPNLAVLLLKKAIEQHPDHAGLHEALGNVYNSGTGDYVFAVEEYEKALKLNPSNATTYYALATLYQHPGVAMTIDEALAYLQKAVALNPDDCQIHRELGVRYWERGRLEEAKTELDSALKYISPQDLHSEDQIKKWLANIRRGQKFQDGFFVK